MCSRGRCGNAGIRRPRRRRSCAGCCATREFILREIQCLSIFLLSPPVAQFLSKLTGGSEIRSRSFLQQSDFGRCCIERFLNARAFDGGRKTRLETSDFDVSCLDEAPRLTNMFSIIDICDCDWSLERCEFFEIVIILLGRSYVTDVAARFAKRAKRTRGAMQSADQLNLLPRS